MTWKYNPFTGKFDYYETAGAGATPGGSDTQVQYNDGGAFAGCPNLLYNKTTKEFTLGSGEAGVDYAINFDGQSNDGALVWMEDEACLNLRAHGATYFEYPGYPPTFLINDILTTSNGARVAFSTQITAQTNDVSELYGFWGGTYDSGSAARGITTQAIGVFGYNYFEGTNTRTIAKAIGVGCGNEYGGTNLTVTTAYGLFAKAFHGGNPTVTNQYGIYIDTSTASCTGDYGLRIANINKGSTNYAIYTSAGLVRFGDQVLAIGGVDISAKDIVTDTTTGTKIGTAASQKLALFNATPIVQPANTVALDDVLVNLGLRASGGYSDFATTIKPRAGTASENTAPTLYTSGTLLTAAVAGAKEFDGKAFYTTPVNSARGIAPSEMFSIVPSGGFALTAGSGVQSAFPTSGDVWTLEGNTSYFFEGLYVINKSGTTCTTAMAFALGGGASITSILYHAIAHNAAANATTATQGSVYVNREASTVINATATTNLAIRFNGIIRMNAGGTVTPQINFSAAPTSPVMAADSFIRFYPIGTKTVQLCGNVA